MAVACARDVYKRQSILFVTAGAFCIEPFFRMFTDDGAILADGLIYARICVGFCFGPFIHICIEKIFQATGKMIFPMALQAIGAILNIILDPILIFGYFGLPAMGVTGAAVALSLIHIFPAEKAAQYIGYAERSNNGG